METRFPNHRKTQTCGWWEEKRDHDASERAGIMIRHLHFKCCTAGGDGAGSQEFLMETKVSILERKTHLRHSASLLAATAKAFPPVLASSLATFCKIRKQDPNSLRNISEGPPAWRYAVALPCLHSKPGGANFPPDLLPLLPQFCRIIMILIISVFLTRVVEKYLT